MNWLSYLALGAQIINAILAAVGQLAAGQPVSIPQIRTYFGKEHVAIDVTVTPLP